jgi:hypothetical protein
MSINELVDECASKYSRTNFKTKLDGYRACTFPGEIDCPYRRNYLNLKQEDGTRKIMPTCDKGYQPISERIRRYFSIPII